ncbi:serine/threonine-protein kinase [Pelagicoccus sp. SDUM812003]|uniref:serine/threonine protein kinase n=1 Tax=Pelagicoccus sp. SDUM812003 TaxID=3041267 RepID=UPI00280F3F61|nr:serine/threonine-protein kinase [Pelagicoccus sp. SDUM812003]MDQ8205255.1 serine/threonine-protein kinase [Pelagicoccus sp. SDUM812003]
MRSADQREEDLFDTARQMSDPTERARYLDQECREDLKMRARLEALLKSSDDAEQFFEDGAQFISSSEAFKSINSDPLDEESIGAKIGRYRLLQRLGDGGCGVVYLAEQEEPVRRVVALKIIRLGMETERVVSRFEAERQALAIMDHPNIARVFDAGTTKQGAPYFVMEHVRGMRLTEFCDRNRLGLVQRLNLFCQVCHAIQHAHQKGIIHGDIKPANIIVSQHDGVPLPKVIDFGIAKATEAGLSELLGTSSQEQLLGTPAYISPEQVEMGGLDVDTRSDIYSLGVLLYELLTGQTPFDGDALVSGGLGELRRILRESIPPKPSARFSSFDAEQQQAVADARKAARLGYANTLRGDLDCIAMKALEKDRRHRYETANSLAMDVQRHLASEPVIAHTPGPLYRFRKLVRRNRGAFAAGGAVAAVLLFGIGLSTWLFVKERDARERAVEAEQQQVRLRHEAELRERLTQAAFLISQERFAEADTLLQDVELTDASVEGAAVFRALGEWHALNERWKKAVQRFEVLLEVNTFEGPDVSSLDYLEIGPAFIEAADFQGYERFRRQAIERFVSMKSPFADRIVKVALLTPANEELIRSLEPLARLTEEARLEADAAGDWFQAAWRSMSLAIYQYRQGNFAGAAEYARMCLEYTQDNAPRTTTAQATLAMALHRMGRFDEALLTLSQAENLFEDKASSIVGRGSPVMGFWFDWAFAKVLLTEAQALLDVGVRHPVR